MTKTYETAMKIFTEQIYGLLVFPWIVKYQSKLSHPPYFLILPVYMARRACDIYYILMFVSLV